MMLIGHDWTSEDYLSIDDVIKMLKLFKTDCNDLEKRHTSLLVRFQEQKEQNQYKAETLVETILQLQEEIKQLKGEAQ